MTPIVLFYLEDPSFEGRKLNDILNQDDEWFEKTHDFIQWIFPLNEISMFNLMAPLLSPEDIDIIKNNDRGIDNLIRSTFRFINFLNLHSDYPKWLYPGNHNYLRITRMLKCLNLFGLNYLAQLIYNRLHYIFQHNEDKISLDNIIYWYEAVADKEC